MYEQQPDAGASIDRLLDRAIQAINRGDRERARALAGQVLAVDATNADAEDLLAAPAGQGEIRRLTILFCDLVDSTVLSAQVEPETYRNVVKRYRELVRRAVDRYEGHIGSTKGDGILAVFGHPKAHENDVRRAVQAGLDITRAVSRLCEQTRKRFDLEVSVRVGVHRGMVYLDTTEDDVYGFAANLASRLESLADPGTVVVSDAVERLVRDDFEFETLPARPVKGVSDPLVHHVVMNERTEDARSRLKSTPFIGRARELAFLEERWSEATTGRLTTPGIALRGEAGVGKTRLSAAMAERIEASGGVVLELVGSPFHTDAGLHPVRTLLERRCGIGRTADASERLQRLEHEIAACGLHAASAVPLLAPVLGVGPETGYEQAQADGRKLHDQIADAVEAYLVACLGRGPGLVLVEDLQWFDATTFDLIRRLLRSGTGSLMVLITTREGAALPGGPHLDVLEVAPLSSDETDELIVALDPHLSTEERTTLRRRSDGLPLYVEQLVAGAGGEDAAAHSAMTTMVPEALYEPLFARLRASAEAIPVATAAATIGRDVDRRVLAAVVDLDDDSLDAVIEELEDALVLEAVHDDLWRFRHEMLREVAYELQPPTARRSVHGRVADALVGSDHDLSDWQIVARHYESAERHEEAASAYEQAADDARRRGALAEARAQLSRAIGEMERVEPGPAHVRQEVALRLARGFLAVAAEGNSSPEAAADFERCLQLCGSDARGDEMFGTLIALWGYYASRADLTRAEQVLESLRETLDDGREVWRPENDAGFGMVAWFRGEFDLARQRLETVTAEVLDNPNKKVEYVWFLPNEPIASLHTHLALARFTQGDLEGAEAELGATARRVEDLGFPQGPFSSAYARSLEVWMRIEAGQLEHAATLADDLAQLAEQHGFDSWMLVAGTQRAAVSALLALRDHPSDPAVSAGHAAVMAGFVDMWRAIEVRAFLTFYYGVVGRLYTAGAQFDDARQRLDEALELAAVTGMQFYDAELVRLRAHTEPDPEVRAIAVAEALQLARKQGAGIFELRAAIDGFEHRGPHTRESLLEAMNRFPTGSTWPELQHARSLLQ